MPSEDKILIDSQLYRCLEVWAQALGYTVDRLAELCILWGSVYLVAITEAGLDPAAECRAFEARLWQSESRKSAA